MDEEDGYVHSVEQDPLLHVERRTANRDEEHLNQASTNYEDAVEATGYGRFHLILLAMCGWALSSDAIEVLSISFILPAASSPQELNLTSSDKGWLNAVIFLGMMVGGYLWGSLADIYGRRRILLFSLTVNGLGGLASSFAQNLWLFFTLRFVSGIGVGGSLPVIFSYYVEFQPKARRGSMISVLATFWMSGSIICAGLAWIIIPRTYLNMASPSFSYSSWRIFLAVCTAPAVSSGLFFFLMPESPRYLLNVGKDEKALSVLRQVYKTNNPNKNPLKDYPVTQLKRLPTLRSDANYIPPSQNICRRILKSLSNLFSRTGALFRAPYTKLTIIMVIIYFTLSFGYYGLFMWFPELFARMATSGGSPCALGNITTAVNTTAAPSVINNKIYAESFITNLSNLPGNIFTCLIIDRIRNGRNILLAGSMVISGLCVFFIAILKTERDSLIMSCIFSGISVIGWNALDVIGMEVYPTDLRSTASGFEMSIGRIASILANVVFGQLVSVHCIIPMFMVAAFMVFGGLSACLLPNRQGHDIDAAIHT